MDLSVPLVKMLMFHIGLLLQNWIFEQKKGLFLIFQALLVVGLDH